jgi:hypothetical protein
VALLPPLEGDRPGVDPVPFRPLRPERASTPERVLGDDRLAGLGLARLVRQLGAVNSPVGVGAVQEAEEASRRRVPELLVSSRAMEASLAS